MDIAVITAFDQHRAIGTNGDLPWGRSLPADLANFKRLTTGGSIIMGRKTFESIGSRPLPDRENIVLSSRPTGVKGVLTAVSLSSAYALARYPTFVIGGAQVYSQALHDATILYITQVDAVFDDADTFFPEINMDEWQETNREHHEADAENLYAFDFVTYTRID